MRTIIVRNAHQALAESCFQLDKFGTSNSEGGKTLPIPSTTTILVPLERVALYAQLQPFDALLGSARDLAEGRLEHVATCAKHLKAKPDTRVTLRPTGECDNIGAVYVQVDMDGKVAMMACCSHTDVILESADMVYLSMVLEYIATTCKREAGALWITSMSPYFREPMAATVAAIASHAPQPPAQYEDPYSSDVIQSTMPLMSIPAGRWDRELKQFFNDDTYDSVEYIDPFIQHVLAPAHRAYQLFLEDAPIPQVQRAIGEIAAQDWMQACLLFSQQDQPCAPKTE